MYVHSCLCTVLVHHYSNSNSSGKHFILDVDSHSCITPKNYIYSLDMYSCVQELFPQQHVKGLVTYPYIRCPHKAKQEENAWAGPFYIIPFSSTSSNSDSELENTSWHQFKVLFVPTRQPPSVVTIEDHIVYIVSGADYIQQADQWQK